MNRELIVKLLHKDIRELEMITSGFMEMTVYPKAIILLAQQKTEDIQLYIQQLSSELPDVEIQPGKTAFVKDIEAVKKFEVEDVIDDIEIDEDEDDVEVDDEVDDEVEEDETIENIEEDVNPEIRDATERTETPVVNETPQIKEYDLSRIIEDTFASKKEPNTDENRKTVLGEKNISATPSRNEMLSKADNSISSTLANKKIDDIKQAINIGDRFRFQRELFRGNGEDMNKTLTYINLLITQEEALSFLQSKYGWASDNETVEDFYQLVRRRFL